MLRGLWNGRGRRDHLTDALTFLNGWSREGQQLRRTLSLSDAQHAALAERIKVVSDVLNLRPDVRRLDGRTQIRVGQCDGEALSEGEVLLAARIEAAYRTTTSEG